MFNPWEAYRIIREAPAMNLSIATVENQGVISNIRLTNEEHFRLTCTSCREPLSDQGVVHSLWLNVRIESEHVEVCYFVKFGIVVEMLSLV